MMGARTLIDMVMVNQGSRDGTFKSRLDELVSTGFLSSREREILKPALDVGHAASHRGYRPDMKHTQHVMDIVENLLQQDSILEPAAQKLKDTTPERPKKKS